MEKLGAQALMASLDEVQPDRMSLKLKVILVSPKATMFSQSLCGTAVPDLAHIVHKGQKQDRYGVMQHQQQP